MKFIQVQLDRDKREGIDGNYFSYEFGIIESDLWDTIDRYTVEFVPLLHSRRSNYSVLKSEAKILGEF